MIMPRMSVAAPVADAPTDPDAMTESTSAATLATASAVAPLPHLGVIRARGEEAAKFLHGQLTNDFSLLGASEARLAALCSAKGRMLASFIGFKGQPGEVLLVCSRDLLPTTLKRLQMFVLRAKVRLEDASAEFEMRGLLGGAEADRPWTRRDGADGGHTIALYPAAGQARALWVAPVGTPAPAGTPASTGQWDWLEVMSGVATVTQPIVEAFVPQMLNYESVGGVNFKKGCYPGQEVVARSQYRGTLKRRAFIVQGDAPLSVGQEVFHASDATQPCGTVAAAAASPAGGWNAIVSMQTSATEGGALTAGSAQGPVLTLLPLPYTLLADV